MIAKLRLLKLKLVLILRGLSCFNRARIDLIMRSLMLSELNRGRVEWVVKWLKKSRLTIVILNIAVLFVLSLFKCRDNVKRKWQQLNNAKLIKRLSLQCDPELPTRVETRQPRVLIIAETSIPQCLLYRVEQKREQFESLNWSCEVMSWVDTDAAKQRSHFADIILFYRVPAFPKSLAVIEYAQRLKKITIYDVDDLIFDRQRLEEKFAQQPAQLSDKEFQDILTGAELYKTAIEHCAYAMTTTPTLQNELEKLVIEQQCFVLPNALSADVYEVLALSKPIKQDDKVILLYGSGTRTHDEDFALVAEVLVRLLQVHESLELAIMGYLTLPVVLENYQDRIQRLPMMDFKSYLMCLRQADISIAPLEAGVFADAKSEIKWLEAAAFKVPCVVSATNIYQTAIDHEKTGFIANNDAQWYQYLNALVADPELRKTIGEQANAVALDKYGCDSMATLMRNNIEKIQQDAITKGHLIAKDAKPIKVMFVNVLYAPNTIGGATIVVERIVNTLHNDYFDQFDVTVVASDVVGTTVNNVREYGYKGVNVTTIGVSMEGDFELNQQSAKTEQIFQQLVDQHRPDLIHFHCIQRLTGSVVAVAKNNNIPFVVTVHDGWWLSEYQFMLDNDGQLINPTQLNPLIAIESATDANASIERTRYLSGLLNQAECIFAVSAYQAKIYRDNGFTNVVVNRNGLLPVEKCERPDYQGKLRLGYLGGVCEHKGYYFLKEIFENADYDNIELFMVDLFKDRDYHETQQWGSTNVNKIGHYKAEQMAEFYANTDVLIAPSIWPESFGLVSREAALHGVWVLAADAGGLAEDIIEGETGWVFPMGDGVELSVILNNLDANAANYVRNRPKSTQSIRLLNEQVAELVNQYKNILTNQQ